MVLSDEHAIDAMGSLVPAAAIASLPHDVDAAAERLGVSRGQLKHMRGGALQAELDIPAGFWRLWPERGLAFWIGRFSHASVPHVAQSSRVELNLEAGLMHLHRAGLWLQEGQLADQDMKWSTPLPLHVVVRRLRQDDDVSGIVGYWGDEAGEVTHAALLGSGEVWLGGPTAAVRWLNILFSPDA